MTSRYGPEPSRGKGITVRSGAIILPLKPELLELQDIEFEYVESEVRRIIDTSLTGEQLNPETRSNLEGQVYEVLLRERFLPYLIPKERVLFRMYMAGAVEPQKAIPVDRNIASTKEEREIFKHLIDGGYVEATQDGRFYYLTKDGALLPFSYAENFIGIVDDFRQRRAKELRVIRKFASFASNRVTDQPHQ